MKFDIKSKTGRYKNFYQIELLNVFDRIVQFLSLTERIYKNFMNGITTIRLLMLVDIDSRVFPNYEYLLKNSNFNSGSIN